MNIKKTPWFLVLGLVLGATACAEGDDSGSGTNTPRNDAGGDVQADCEAFVSKYCEWYAPCHSMSKPDCNASAKHDLPGGSCSGVDAIGETYDACMKSIDALTCDATSLPTSCAGALVIKEPEPITPDAPAACDAFVAKYCQKGVVPCNSVTQADCVSGVLEQLPGGSCAGADGVGATYDACMVDVESMTCGGDLPSSCKGVLKFEE